MKIIMLGNIKKSLRLYVLLIFGLICFNLQAQISVHNYVSPSNGETVQMGFCNGFILFRFVSPQQPQMSRLNYICNKDGWNYYGTNSFQVALTMDSRKACVLSQNYSNTFNYRETISVPNPFQDRPYQQGSNVNRNSGQQKSYKCHACNGTGRIVRNDPVTQYVTSDVKVDVKCRECGVTYCKNYTNHYHLNCGKCGGTGRVRY